MVSQSYARIFFRNCISTGELYPVETDVRLCDELTTGEEVTLDMERDVLVVHASGKEYSLKPIGDVRGAGGWGARGNSAASVRPVSGVCNSGGDILPKAWPLAVGGATSWAGDCGRHARLALEHPGLSLPSLNA